MKAKRYVPTTFLPVTNETYQENFDSIFRKGKKQGEIDSSLKEVHRTFESAGGHKHIYAFNTKARLRDLG